MTPDDWKCRECGNFVMYRSDHKSSCVYYVNPKLVFVNSN